MWKGAEKGQGHGVGAGLAKAVGEGGEGVRAQCLFTHTRISLPIPLTPPANPPAPSFHPPPPAPKCYPFR